MRYADKNLRELFDPGIIAVIRTDGCGTTLQIIQAIHAGGIACIELTMTTPGALRTIEEASTTLPKTTIGAGTVLDAPTARLAILAGARFLVTPTVNIAALETAHRYGIPAIIGAMTPTEILTAWESGADMVKVFPASVVGPAFVREMRGPLPQIPLVPTGGITADNAGEFIRAGAAAVCAGSWLVDKQAVAEGRYEVIEEKARRLVEAVRKAREKAAR